MPGSNVVIVESPAKAKTINKYLGPDFEVIASYGHIRDLPAKDGSVRPDDDFAMSWEPGDRSRDHIDRIARAVRNAERIYLATDPDREGEAISWHVQEVLREQALLGEVDVQRVTFNEITKSAVQDAFQNPRPLNQELIEAYLARRALDYLVGFTLSPILWRKLPGSKSAGRVQSVALRLICEREAEIEVFKPQEYWTVEAVLTTPDGATFTARLTHLDGGKLDKFALKTEVDARSAATRIEGAALHVSEIERKRVKRNPPPPFITSTLQQEASRKLGFSATKTMRTAQKLYEGIDLDGETVGLITYMRTDGVQLSREAIDSARSVIGETYGGRYVPDQPRIYKSTAKNAQEAHEAIRPTDLTRTPESLSRQLDADGSRLYELIWKRTIACEMASAELDQVAVDIADPSAGVTLRATGSIVAFDGFYRVYREGSDEADDDGDSRELPAMQEHQPLGQKQVTPNQHFTQPPPRYTEASLVKKLEELGIGRPSTYASILQVLQDREYVRLEKRRFMPEDRGRLVTAFLTSYFEQYVEYSFTADLEQKLDEVSAGRIDWKALLREFWDAFSHRIEETRGLKISDVIDAIDGELGPHFFPEDAGDGRNPRTCPACSDGRLSLKFGKFGAFIGCSNYPECRYTRPLVVSNGEDGQDDAEAAMPRELGTDPETGLPVTVKRGPYGLYVQLGPAEGDEGKPKRVSLPRGHSLADLDLETALKLLALPREIGTHPETGELISAGIGRYGPYIKHGSSYKSLTADDDVLTIGINRAVALLGEASNRRGSGVLRELGEHPRDSKPVTLNRGRFGPYVKHGKTMASVPKAEDADSVTLERAVELVDAKAANAKSVSGKSAGKGKSSTKAAGAKAGSTKSTTKAAKSGSPAGKSTTSKAKSTTSKTKATAKAKTATSKTKATAPGSAAGEDGNGSSPGQESQAPSSKAPKAKSSGSPKASGRSAKSARSKAETGPGPTASGD